MNVIPVDLRRWMKRRRHGPSKRRWLARFRQGKAIPWLVLEEHPDLKWKCYPQRYLPQLDAVRRVS